MKLRNYICLFILTGLMCSCELIESPDSTASPSEGFITYPALILEGEQLLTLDMGVAYDEPGAIATLGQDDISDQVVVTGMVDVNTPGVYILNYTLNITNELNEESTVSRSRYVAVATEEAKSIDLTGSYAGDGTAISATWNQTATVTRTTGVWHSIDKGLASGNNLGLFFAIVGDVSQSPNLVVPDQSTPFGNVNTTDAGTNGQLNSDGFQWTIFVGCCGNFGPIIYSR